MVNSNSDDIGPKERDQREIGVELVEQSTGLGSRWPAPTGAK